MPHANTTAIITVDGMPRTVREGELFDPSDPIVREFWWLFETPVEEATSIPGQRRNARKP